jgi:hypothetical protein
MVTSVLTVVFLLRLPPFERAGDPWLQNSSASLAALNCWYAALRDSTCRWHFPLLHLAFFGIDEADQGYHLTESFEKQIRQQDFVPCI